MEHYDPKTIAERRVVAGESQMVPQYGIRTYVDEMDDYVNTAYAAWPTRLYLIELDGRVVYPGGVLPNWYETQRIARCNRQLSEQIQESR